MAASSYISMIEPSSFVALMKDPKWRAEFLGLLDSDKTMRKSKTVLLADKHKMQSLRYFANTALPSKNGTESRPC